MRITARVAVFGAIVLALTARASAQVEGVGQVSFPNSGAAAAQQDFLSGLDAKAIVKRCYQGVSSAKQPLWGPFTIVRSRYLIDTEEWTGHQPQEARAAFEKALARTPERTAALVGLMKAAASTGDTKKEAAIKARLHTIWHGADRKVSDGAKR
jgi:hypothetical protein